MSGLSNQQLAQQWFSKLSPRQQQQHLIRVAQRAQHQTGQPQRQQQQVPRMPLSNAARHQQPPLKQGHPHAQTMQQSSPTQKGSPPSARQTSHPSIAGQKRQATDAPNGTAHANKRQNMMPPSATVTQTAPMRQNNNFPHQPGSYRKTNGVPTVSPNGVPAATDRPNTDEINRQRREQETKLAERRTREQRIYDAEKARVAEQYRVALAATLKREQDEKRREELRKDPSANYRHILEVYKLFPLDYKKGESPNRYLTGLLANRSMPMDTDCDTALAIEYAKDHWECFGQWPKDIKRFADYERERREKAKATG